MNHIEEIDTRGRLVRAQSGVKLGTLNAALRLHGLCLPIDYDPEATIGGLIANCPNDDASREYGGIFHYVERAEIVLAVATAFSLRPIIIAPLTRKIFPTLPKALFTARFKKFSTIMATQLLIVVCALSILPAMPILHA